MKKHYRKYFVDWQEGRLSQKQKGELEAHLSDCSECRGYFAKMEMLFSRPAADLLPAVEVKPFALTAILSRAKNQAIKEAAQFPIHSWKTAVIWASLWMIALVGGIQMGRGLDEAVVNKQTNAQYSSQSQLTELSESRFDTILENLTGSSQGENNEN